MNLFTLIPIRLIGLNNPFLDPATTIWGIPSWQKIYSATSLLRARSSAYARYSYCTKPLFGLLIGNYKNLVDRSTHRFTPSELCFENQVPTENTQMRQKPRSVRIETFIGKLVVPYAGECHAAYPTMKIYHWLIDARISLHLIAP